jgi:hypothetical protein
MSLCKKAWALHVEAQQGQTLLQLAFNATMVAPGRQEIKQKVLGLVCRRWQEADAPPFDAQTVLGK